ncbi:MAG: hypothetical protein NTW16_00740 [Bacteroidetes bacterium]|nr:hypothetical protein [Bacteroidota bacterium]
MTIEKIYDISAAASPYSDLFGIGKSKAARAEAKAKRQEKRADKKVNKERTKGAAERARMGLEDLPTPALAGQAPAAKSKVLIYAGAAGAVILVMVILMFIKK